MAEPLLEIEGVEVRRGMGTVLSDFTLALHPGEIIVLHGLNGSGKSTVIETAARLLPLERGHVNHHGSLTIHADGRRMNPAHPFGLTLQSNGMIGSETVEHHLTMVAQLSGANIDLSTLLESYGLQHRLRDRMCHLSGGQARKVAVLAGLIPAMVATTPVITLLDEPDTGLDETAIEALKGHIQSLAGFGHGFVIATHNSELMQIATHLHDLKQKSTQNTTPSTGWQPLGTKAEHSFIKMRAGHRYSRSTRSGFARNGLAALLVLGCILALGDPLQLPKGLWLTGGILAPAFAAGLSGDPTTHLLRENRAYDWWRAQGQTTPSATGLGALIGLVSTMVSCSIFIGTLDPVLLFIGSFIGESTMLGVRMLHTSTQRLARPQAVFIRLLMPVFILPWALIVSWASGL